MNECIILYWFFGIPVHQLFDELPLNFFDARLGWQEDDCVWDCSEEWDTDSMTMSPPLTLHLQLFLQVLCVCIFEIVKLIWRMSLRLPLPQTTSGHIQLFWLEPEVVNLCDFRFRSINSILFTWLASWVHWLSLQWQPVSWVEGPRPSPWKKGLTFGDPMWQWTTCSKERWKGGSFWTSCLICIRHFTSNVTGLPRQTKLVMWVIMVNHGVSFFFLMCLCQCHCATTCRFDSTNSPFRPFLVIVVAKG